MILSKINDNNSSKLVLNTLEPVSLTFGNGMTLFV